MQKKTKTLLSVVVVVAILALVRIGVLPQSVLSSLSPSTQTQTQATVGAPITDFEGVADYLREHGELPDNFITKREATTLGWVAREGNLAEVAPGMSIGGDVFSNAEGLLPKAKGRVWYECDIGYTSGGRGAHRIVFSSDGLIYKTEDHYETFEEM